jgi:Protein of unknown function (DUF2752)
VTPPNSAAGESFVATSGRLSDVERRGRLKTAALLALGLAVAAVLPARRPLPFDACVWHALTGYRCLTCGLTRSICLLMQGEPAASLAMHPGGVVAMALVAWHALRSFVESVTGRRRRASAWERLRRRTRSARSIHPASA